MVYRNNKAINFKFTVVRKFFSFCILFIFVILFYKNVLHSPIRSRLFTSKSQNSSDESTKLDQQVASSLPIFSETFEYLKLDNFMSSPVQPFQNGQNIFFLDTMRMRKRNLTREFTSRQG